MKSRFKATRLMVAISVIGAALSFVTIYFKIGEIYPFYYWKLYSQPAAWEGKGSYFRVYVKEKGKLVRMTNEPRKSFTRDDFGDTLDFILEDTTSNTEVCMKRLKAFCTHLFPGYDEYHIVKETFNPIEVYHNPSRVDTSTVVIVYAK